MPYSILGINDEVTTCECCGRSNLKKTVIITDGLNERRLGTACASKFLGWKKTVVENKAISAEYLKSFVTHYIIYNSAVKRYVGGIAPVRFATRNAAQERIDRMADKEQAQIVACYN